MLGPTRRSIALQTHRGSDIKNEIAPGPEERHVRKYRLLFERFRPRWTERKPPSGAYNCVGHVWACRRTAVFDDLERQITVICRADGYRAIDRLREPLAVGDLATYWEAARGHRTFWHVGVISELRPGLAAGSPPIPYVLSKWDDTSGEVLHNYADHPFPDGIEVEFWTDRPPIRG
ncbi:MAG TPA: hypothetical protein VG406_08400 [Isosphaeraceae bacterium]|nr:hypothetical protein [Isosphaeraceae bacterium]